MIPAAFDQENGVLNPPIGMSSAECETLSVWRGVLENRMPVVITCWKVTKEELEEIQRTGRVWLTVMGTTMPPVIIEGASPWSKPSIHKEAT